MLQPPYQGGHCGVIALYGIQERGEAPERIAVDRVWLIPRLPKNIIARADTPLKIGFQSRFPNHLLTGN